MSVLAKTTRKRNSNNKRIGLHVSKQMKELVEQAACICGQSVTEFTLSALKQQAEFVLDKHRQIRLSERDQSLFLTLVTSNEKPNDVLTQAIVRYRKTIKER